MTCQLPSGHAEELWMVGAVGAAGAINSIVKVGTGRGEVIGFCVGICVDVPLKLSFSAVAIPVIVALLLIVILPFVPAGPITWELLSILILAEPKMPLESTAGMVANSTATLTVFVAPFTDPTDCRQYQPEAGAVPFAGAAR